VGRRSHSRHLSVWLNGRRAATWTLARRGDTQLRYDETWVRSHYGRPLSLSLPFNLQNRPLEGDRVLHYFDNLLPDSDAIRKRVAERFRTGSVEPFDLLKAIGRDCVGAVQLLGEDETPEGYDRVEGMPLSEDDIERAIGDALTPGRFAATHDADSDFRISLAGAQEKTALLRWNGRWLRPLGSTPTTHILKLPLGLVGGRQADFTTSVDNEWLCLRLLAAYGLDVARAEIATFGGRRVLVVERFDRQTSSDGRWIQRLPQEDFCQVENCPPLRKYESDGGPGLRTLFERLKQSEQAEADARTLMTTQILFWLLRAPDGHAKNFSIRLLPAGRFHLTPLYDVMSAYPVLGEGPSLWSPHRTHLAMALLGKSRHYLMHTIQRRHFNSTARLVGYGDSAEPLIEAILARTPAAIDEVRASLPADFSAEVADSILGGLRRAADVLAAMPAA